MSSSVAARSVRGSLASERSKRDRSSGAPNRTVTFLNGRGRFEPGRWTSEVPTIPTGITGTPHPRARRATPVCPRYRRPSGERVPSG